MSDEKIDLAEVVMAAEGFELHDVVLVLAEEVLALVRAVRAAREFAKTDDPTRAMLLFVELDAALAPFTDSAIYDAEAVR